MQWGSELGIGREGEKQGDRKRESLKWVERFMEQLSKEDEEVVEEAPGPEGA